MTDTLTWKRGDEPGLYTAGPYTIVKGANQWHLTGPGGGCGSPARQLNEPHFTKREAQRSALYAARRRLEGHAMCAVPVVNDVAEYAGQRCRVSMITATADSTPLYCLVKPRGKRQCLLRNEFKVVMP